MRSWWSMKSKSIQKIGLPSTWPMGRVVVPRPVRWKGTFHQWLRRTLAASRVFPTTWQNRCRVCLVSRQEAIGIGGNSSIALHPSVTRGEDVGHPAITCADLAEGEGVGVDAWVEESDLEGALADRAGLADELVQPWFGDSAGALVVHVGPVGGSWG